MNGGNTIGDSSPCPQSVSNTRIIFQPSIQRETPVEESYSKETFETVAVADNKAAGLTRSSPFSKFLTEMNERINKQLRGAEDVETIDTDANLAEL